MRDLEFVTEPADARNSSAEPADATDEGEVVSRPATRTPHPTRTGGQDDGSYTNSLKISCTYIVYIKGSAHAADP